MEVRKAITRLFLAAAALLPMLCTGQGTFQFTHITFDGPPLQPPGSVYNVQQYFESGMWFRPLPGSIGFGRAWSNPPSALPDNGTPYVQAALGQSLAFSFQDNSLFGMASVDLAGYSTVVPNVTAHFYGYRADGSVIYTAFHPSGIEFQTYYFGPEWNNLTRVEVPDFGSLDNLVVWIPEPTTNALLMLGALAFIFLRMKEKKS